MCFGQAVPLEGLNALSRHPAPNVGADDCHDDHLSSGARHTGSTASHSPCASFRPNVHRAALRAADSRQSAVVHNACLGTDSSSGQLAGSLVNSSKPVARSRNKHRSKRRRAPSLHRL